MNGADFRAGIRRGLAEAIEIVEWEERKWAPGVQPTSRIARTRHAQSARHLAFRTAKKRLFVQLKQYERQHYAKGDSYTGEAVRVTVVSS